MPAGASRKRQLQAEEPEDENEEYSEEENGGGGGVARTVSSGGGGCTSISKLAIQGIRAFSPQSEQTIEFYKPLTMIVGANGCGKTTIIECLKYVCTGTPPPGGDKGKSFVHDPKLAGLPEVKANIKLRFQNTGGQEMVVVRSLQLTQKKSQSTFKTLDGVIKMTNSDGKRVAMSHKCGELDKQVPILMGVSKAILENVIFCHQEESSWPLGDPASLKKKFDDIFESSRYSKALESIRKTKMEYHKKASDMKVEIASLDAYRQQAEVIQKDVDDCESKLTRYKAKDQKQSEALVSIEQEMEAHQAHSRKVRDKKVSLEKKHGDLDLMEARLKDKISTTQLMDEPEDELKNRLEAVRSEEAKVAGGLADLEKKKDKATRKKAQAQESLNTLNIKIGTLKSEESREKAEMEGLGNFASRLRKTHGVKAVVKAPTDPKFIETMTTFGEELNQKEEEAQINLVTAQSTNEVEVKDIRDQISSMQSEIVSLEGRHQHAQEQIEKLEKEHTEVHGEMIGISGGSNKASRELERAREKRDKAEAELKIQRNDPNLKKLEIEIRDLDETYKNANDVISELKMHKQRLSGTEEEDTKITEALDAISDKIAFITHDANKHRAKFTEFLGTNLHLENTDELRQQAASMRSKLTEAEEALEMSVNKKTDKDKAVVQVETRIEQAEKVLSGLTVETKKFSGAGGVDEQFAQLVKEAKDFHMALDDADDDSAAEDTQISQGVSIHTIEELVQFIGKDKALSEANLGEVEGTRRFAAKMLRKAAKSMSSGDSRPVCGCCNHKMSETEYENFKKKFALYSNWEKEDVEKQVTAVSELLGKAMHLKGSFESKFELKAKESDVKDELENYRRELESLSSEAADLEVEVEKNETAIQNVKAVYEEISKICSEVVELRRSEDEWNTRKQRLDEKQSQGSTATLPENCANRLVDVLKLLSKKEEDRDRVAELSQDKKEEREKLNRRKEIADLSYHQAREEFDRLEVVARKFKDLEARKKQLEAQLQVLEETKVDVKNGVEPKKVKLCEVRAKCDKLTAAWKSEEVKLREVHSLLLKDTHEFRRLYATVKSFQDKRTSQQRSEAESDVQRANASIQKYDSQIQECDVELQQIEHEQAEKELVVTKLEANLMILSLRRDIKSCKDDIILIKNAIASMSTGTADLQHTFEECEDNKQILLQERAENKGKMGAMERQKAALLERLKESNYRNIKERTRKKRVEHETTNMAVDDLEKYWGALDKALLRFHGQKINDINRIIRELWQRTYCGEDIDGIEIVSGEEGGSTRAARSYNYRVVMRKGNTALDMRGRCSAGQRVLACIVIRLALAETFCVSCGILTLDEPTTNLDEYNKSGLASSLADIISARSKQRNFQLIVITHDGDFVNHMRDAFNALGADRCFNLPEFYWRICRNQTGSNGQYCSEIHRTEWDDM